MIDNIIYLRNRLEKSISNLEFDTEEFDLLVKFERILSKVQDHTIGSCNCLTKTPDPKYHAERCTYRILMDIIAI